MPAQFERPIPIEYDERFFRYFVHKTIDRFIDNGWHGRGMQVQMRDLHCIFYLMCVGTQDFLITGRFVASISGPIHDGLKRYLAECGTSLADPFLYPVAIYPAVDAALDRIENAFSLDHSGLIMLAQNTVGWRTAYGAYMHDRDAGISVSLKHIKDDDIFESRIDFGSLTKVYYSNQPIPAIAFVPNPRDVMW